MTGGRAVVLGQTGKNFAAGMSGGIAYVLDENHELYLKLNKQMITMTEITEQHDADEAEKADICSCGGNRLAART